MYAVLYMAAQRTQIYLTAEQRAGLDDLASTQGRSMADLIREAVDDLLTREGAGVDPNEVFDASFGRCPDLTVPSRDEWSRG